MSNLAVHLLAADDFTGFCGGFTGSPPDYSPWLFCAVVMTPVAFMALMLLLKRKR
jgi:hypothetical protein